MDNERILNKLALVQTTIDEIKNEILTEQHVKEPIKQPEHPQALKPVFPPELESYVTMEEDGSKWKITPSKFLGSQIFSDILTIVRDQQGTYLPSQGKGQPGHFEIPK